MSVTVDGRVLRTGTDIVGYLDDFLHRLNSDGQTATGIIIGTEARKLLSRACQEIMGQKVKDEMTVNRFRNALLIEDGANPERVEVVYARNPTLPQDQNDVFAKGLRRIR